MTWCAYIINGCTWKTTSTRLFDNMEARGSLLKTHEEDKSVIVAPNKCAKRTRANLTTTANSTAKAATTKYINVFLDHWVMPYRIPFYIITYNRPQSVGKFFRTVRSLFRLLRLATTADYPKPVEQIEQHSMESWRDSDKTQRSTRQVGPLTQWLTYAYSTKRSTWRNSQSLRYFCSENGLLQ